MTSAFFPGRSECTWIAENGLEVKTKDIRPVVDETAGRLYAVTQSGLVILLKEYEAFRRHCARNAAITFWGDPRNWDPIEERIVSCTCLGCDPKRSDVSSAWRITGHEMGIVTARIVSRSDVGIALITDEHTVYTSPFLLVTGYEAEMDERRASVDASQTARSVGVDMFAAMIERFGEPYDMATGRINPPYEFLYRHENVSDA